MAKIEVNVAKPSYDVEEALKLLRTNLVYSGNIQTLMVTSTFMGEGKSTMTMQLARSFAELNKKVLVIDCDMRKTQMYSRYHIKQKTAGFSEFLTGQSSKVIYETDVPNLSVILSGKLPPNPAELLSTDRPQILLETLKGHYDYILLDAPPIGSVVDAAILGRAVDGILMVVRNDYVKKTAVRRAKAQLEKNGGKVLGVILNRVENGHKDYYGHKYRYYGHDEQKS